MTKNGLRTFDVRSAVVELEVLDAGMMRLVSRHQTPLVRPDDVVSALRQLRPELAGDRPPLLTRVAQGTLAGEGSEAVLTDPFSGASHRPW